MSNDLFDTYEAEARRDTAIADVEANANEAWCALAMLMIQRIAESKAEFTSDDVWKALSYYPTVQTHQPSAMGAMFRKASSNKLITATDRFVQSARPISHARPIRVWSSQLIKE
jgi:hypothetical protein